MAKKIRNNVLLAMHFYLVITLNVIVMLYIFNKSPSTVESVMMFLGFNVAGYLFSWNKFYNFDYDSKSILITNSWNPFVLLEIDVKNIKNISLDYSNGAGFEVRITWGYVSESFLATSIEEKDLQEMVDEINKIIGGR